MEGSQISRVRRFSLDLGGFLLKVGNAGLVRMDTEAQDKVLLEKRAQRSLIKVWSKETSLVTLQRMTEGRFGR